MTSASAEPCRIRLVAGRDASAWRREVKNVERKLADADANDSDCQDISVDVSAAGSRVVLVTPDGRRAERPVERPSDLGPTIGALVITVQQSEPEPARSPPVEADAPRKPVERSAPLATASAVSKRHLMLQLAGMGRLAAPGAWASPAFGGALFFAAGGWEVGAGAQWQPATYVLSGTTAAGFETSSLAFTLDGGLRRGDEAVAWLAGVSSELAFVYEQVTYVDTGTMMMGNMVDVGNASRVESVQPIEARVGVYAGMAFPARARLRLRPQLDAHAVAVRFRDQRRAGSLLPPLPNFSVALALGLEGDVL